MNNPEISLIAMLLNYPENYDKVKSLPNVFRERRCRYIFSVIKKQVNYSKSTVMSVIEQTKVMTTTEFYDVYEYFFDEENIDSYIDYVLSQYSKGMIIDYATKLKRTDYIRYDEIKDGIEKITTQINSTTDQDIQSAKEVITEMQAKQETICRLVPFGIPYFDLYGGLESTDYVILAARPSDGKTTSAFNLMGEDVVNKIKPGFFTTETNNQKVMSTMACLFAGVEEIKYRTNNMTIPERDKLSKAFSMLNETEIYLDGTPRLYLNSLKKKARKMVKKYGVQKIYIDYLQRIRHQDRKLNGKYEIITHISEELKALAVELEVPIICLAQLNRNNEKENREPKKSDLRGSGDIEQDADIIILLHHQVIRDDGTVLVKNIVDKYRNGPQGSYNTIFNKQLRRIRYYG